jgi:hypothetical protein
MSSATMVATAEPDVFSSRSKLISVLGAAQNGIVFLGLNKKKRHRVAVNQHSSNDTDADPYEGKLVWIILHFALAKKKNQFCLYGTKLLP